MDNLESKIATILGIEATQVDQLLDQLDISQFADIMSFVDTDQLTKIKSMLEPMIPQTIKESDEEPDLGKLVVMAADQIGNGFDDDYITWVDSQVLDGAKRQDFALVMNLIGDIQGEMLASGDSFEKVIQGFFTNNLETLGVSPSQVKYFLKKDTPELFEAVEVGQGLPDQASEYHVTSRIKWLIDNKDIDLIDAMAKYSKDFNMPLSKVEKIINDNLELFENEECNEPADLVVDVKRIMKNQKCDLKTAIKKCADLHDININQVEKAVKGFENIFAGYSNKMDKRIAESQMNIIKTRLRRQSSSIFAGTSVTQSEKILESFSGIKKYQIKKILESDVNELGKIHAKFRGFKYPGLVESQMSRSQLIDQTVKNVIGYRNDK